MSALSINTLVFSTDKISLHHVATITEYLKKTQEKEIDFHEALGINAYAKFISQTKDECNVACDKWEIFWPAKVHTALLGYFDGEPLYGKGRTLQAVVEFYQVRD